MCLNPIKLRSPCRYISLYGGQPLTIKVSCGKCAECSDIIRLQWRFRAYHHIKNHIEQKGNFMYFDTLTYAPEHLPMISHYIDISDTSIKDFSCFDLHHFKQFLKNLRRQLDYYYKGSKFDYFLTSEYGLDDRYTHRPHYHIIFFVSPSTQKLNGLTFSQLVSKCWQYGRTDGIPYKSRKYVLEHIYGKTTNNDFPLIIKACNYVAKYISKDTKFTKVLTARIMELKEHFTDEELKPIIRRINQFHRQSQGFGISYIDTIDDRQNEAIYNGCVYMMDSDKVVAKIPLPLYYQRKLFYEYCKRDDGTAYWRPTQLGVEYLRIKLLSSIDKETQKLYDIYYNTSTANQKEILSILNTRTLQNFAVYKLMYKGRLCSSISLKFMSSNTHKLQSLQSPKVWIENIVKSYNYNDDIFRLEVDDKIVNVYRSQQLSLFSDINYIKIDYAEFIRQFTYNEKSHVEFKDFDKLEALFDEITKDDRIKKQQAFELKEEQSKRNKIIFGKS